MNTCARRPKGGATLCKVRSLKSTELSHHAKRRSFLYYNPPKRKIAEVVKLQRFYSSAGDFSILVSGN